MRTASWPFVAALLVAGTVGTDASAQDVQDLGTLPTFDRARAQDINASGNVAGQAYRSDLAVRPQAVRWSRGHRGRFAPEALPPLPGMTDGNAFAISNWGGVVGQSSIPGLIRAVAWKKEPGIGWQPIDLEPPPGLTNASANGVNSRGWIVGNASNPAVLDSSRAVVWFPRRGDSFEACDLGVPDGYRTSLATAINEGSDVVGTASRPEIDDLGRPFTRADVVVWSRLRALDGACNAVATVLPSLPGFLFNVQPSIGDVGDVVARANGQLDTTGMSRPALWRRCGRTYQRPIALPVPEGFTDATARDVNSGGQILGDALLRQGGQLLASRVVVWRRSHQGAWAATLLDAPEGVAFTSSNRLNERGEAVGSAPFPPPGDSGALLWSPAPCRRHRGDDDDGGHRRHADE